MNVELMDFGGVAAGVLIGSLCVWAVHTIFKQSPAVRCQRKHLVKLAEYWFNVSRSFEQRHEYSKAIMAMEQAYNHVENALAAERENKVLENHL